MPCCPAVIDLLREEGPQRIYAREIEQKSEQTENPFLREHARFYTFGLADSVKYAIMHDITYTPEEIAAAYDYLIHNSAFDLVEHPRI